MAKREHRKLGEILAEWGVITPTGVQEAMEHAQKQGMRLGEAIIALGLADEEDVTKALASQHNMEYIDLDRNVIPPGEISSIPVDLIRKYLVIPAGKEENRLKVIISDPLALEVLDLLRFRLNCEIEPCLGSRTKLRAYIDQFARSDVSIDEAVKTMHASVDQDVEDVVAGDDQLDENAAPIIRLVTMLITQAVNSRASDIHIEPMANRVRVRYRIDGVCVERDNIPKRMQGPVLNRIKIMAKIDLAQRRVPQDGRIQMPIAGSLVDFRVSSLPANHGESIVLRILRPDSVRLGIEALGFESDDNSRFNGIIKRPNGIFLVTGPTGSGKTTTLYAAINELNRPDRKIITAEDPVEYNFTGVNQVQVNDSIGLTFSRILRAMLRQAPNIILVGEIRDMEVAEVAIQAALTGHLVFSTLHTNDAPSAITRLIEMGVKPFLVASSIQAVLAQRLIRVICKECKEPYPDPDPRMMKMLGFTEEELKHITPMRGKGCNACHGTGFRGRQGIFELMEMDNQLRELAFNRASLSEVRRAAHASGMRSLLEDGRLKIAKGITTPEEVLKTTQLEDMITD